MARNEQMIAALKRERAGYVAAGDGDRVAQVDEQLKAHGYTGQQDPPASALTDDDGAPKGRTSKPSRTATSSGGRKQAAAKTPKTQTPKTPPETPAGGSAKDGPSAGGDGAPKGDGAGE